MQITIKFGLIKSVHFRATFHFYRFEPSTLDPALGPIVRPLLNNVSDSNKKWIPKLFTVDHDTLQYLKNIYKKVMKFLLKPREKSCLTSTHLKVSKYGRLLSILLNTVSDHKK